MQMRMELPGLSGMALLSSVPSPLSSFIRICTRYPTDPSPMEVTNAICIAGSSGHFSSFVLLAHQDSGLPDASSITGELSPPSWFSSHFSIRSSYPGSVLSSRSGTPPSISQLLIPSLYL